MHGARLFGQLPNGPSQQSPRQQHGHHENSPWDLIMFSRCVTVHQVQAGGPGRATPPPPPPTTRIGAVSRTAGGRRSGIGRRVTNGGWIATAGGGRLGGVDGRVR